VGSFSLLIFAQGGLTLFYKKQKSFPLSQGEEKMIVMAGVIGKTTAPSADGQHYEK